MIDTHTIPFPDWGVYPVLFRIGKLPVDSYSAFVILALFFGALVFFLEARKQKSLSDQTFYVLIAALVGGILGSKIPVWIFHYREIISALPDISPLISGRTIVGGLIGGTLGVMAVKSKLGIKEKKGNIFAPAVALGIAIGRIGCFLRGCCYGIPTSLPWGVDFGDGIARHPTQLYESLFAICFFIYVQFAKKRNPSPGILFKQLMVSYFLFRFFIEFIRVEEIIFLGFTGFQWASLGVLAYYGLTSVQEHL